MLVTCGRGEVRFVAGPYKQYLACIPVSFAERHAVGTEHSKQHCGAKLNNDVDTPHPIYCVLHVLAGFACVEQLESGRPPAMATTQGARGRRPARQRSQHHPYEAGQPALRLPGSLHTNITKLCSLGITRTHCPSAAVTLCIGTPLIQWNENLGLNPKITDVRFLVDAQCLDLLRTLGESTMAMKYQGSVCPGWGRGGQHKKKTVFDRHNIPLPQIMSWEKG